MTHVDIVILSRDDGPLPAVVERGLAAQAGVRFTVHRVIGGMQPGEVHRWQTIARLRNLGKRHGSSPWLMFLDDDVELEPQAIVRLLAGLRERPRYAALAADYRQHVEEGPAIHVPMGATLFRRSALDLIRVRCAPRKCECRCCCDDLRRHGWGIGFCPGVRARHWDRNDRQMQPAAGAGPAPREVPQVRQPDVTNETTRPRIAGCVLAAVDRRHTPKFRRQFLGSLRSAGNHERVLAVGYGLYPSDRARLRNLPGVELVVLPDSRTMPPIRRLVDFQPLVARLPPETPVAYWDAGDVFFQDRLEGLWRLVRESGDRLLAVREPRGYPENAAVSAWTLSIADPEWRRRAFRLLQERPFLNSGFAAGTARAMLDYFREAHRLRHSRELRGSRDWGDQMALNLYCHLDPDRWREIPEGWNYCAHDRARGEWRVTAAGRAVSRRGTPIHVVHGNAHSFRNLELAGF